MPTTLAYSPLTPQDSAEFLRPYPCRYARYAETRPLQPLKGHQKPCAASVSYRASVPSGHGGRGGAPSYRALAPGGAGLPSGIEGYRSDAARPTANSSYTFSAKERDPEIGLSYFGSRYYSSDLSVWLSVDPMSDKYPSLSPYVYCANNPIKLVDPNGDTIAVVINQKRYTYDGNNLVDKNGNIATFGKNTFGGRVLSDLNKLKNSKCEMIRNKLRDMMNSKHLHTIVNRTTPKGVGYNRALNTELAEKYGEGSDTETGYNPFATKSVCADGGYVSCATLAHELLGHGWNNDQGLHESDDHRTKNGIKFEEINAINVQNKVLVEYLQKPRSLVGSSDDAKQIPVNLINHYYTTKPK